MASSSHFVMSEIPLLLKWKFSIPFAALETVYFLVESSLTCAKSTTICMYIIVKLLKYINVQYLSLFLFLL